jgi:predicted transcriptional regulator
VQRPTTRTTVRVSHLTFALALKRMLRGPFTIHDISEETGLARRTASEMIGSLLSKGVATLRGKVPPPPGGRYKQNEFVLEWT